MNPPETDINEILQQWATSTRENRKDEILKNHSPNVLIFDVLAPIQHLGAEAYRKTWDEWQPETSGLGLFELEELKITADEQVGFAHCLIRCGGTLTDGRKFEDLVRATFCLRCEAGKWRIEHQHISMPK